MDCCSLSRVAADPPNQIAAGLCYGAKPMADNNGWQAKMAAALRVELDARRYQFDEIAGEPED
jgi:hypothetical protein